MIVRLMSKPVNRQNPELAVERRGIQSVEIAFRVLSALQRSHEPVALRDIAAHAGLTASATNNYLVSLVRTGLASVAGRPGHYRLGAASLALGMSALQQIDRYEVVRQEITALRDATARNSALTGWSEAGPISLFKQDGEHRGAFELRTGIIPLTSTAAGRVFMACLRAAESLPLVEKELEASRVGAAGAQAAVTEARRELDRNRYVAVTREHASGYVSIAAPVWDVHGEMRFAFSLMGSRGTLDTGRAGPHVKALLEATERATTALGGHHGGVAGGTARARA
jgi:DNA-binding IclR family transcriptional regulator